MNAALMHREQRPSPEGAASFDVPKTYDTGRAPAPWRDDVARIQHMAMVDAYRRNGGLLSGDEVALLLRAHSPQPC
jgi:hypothetical protein